MDTHLKTDSFRPENASRIRLIGWFLIATEVVSCIYSCLTSSYVASRLNTAELTFSGTPDFESTTIFMGLICFVLAEVFQRGSKIEQEHALTI